MLFPDIPSQKSPLHDESYLVFARKYRPQNFDTLIGQHHLVEALTNAFATDRIAHAYILTGVRGVGKTTTARIIAKGLNCLGSDVPTVKPCGICANCLSITDGKNIDVFEMDAASRTGIGDIREIIDALPYKPLTCRYKVYIIDEVHMLSNAAFNGLLKTLEEPPGHVKFIFATTEIHKIPATILSRCQRFDLKRIDTHLLISFFQSILTQENISSEPLALAHIARVAGGSVRDGLSLLDQAVALGKTHITSQAVSDMIGIVHDDAILDIIKSCLSYDASGALQQFHALQQSGLDAVLFSRETLRHLEFLIRAKFLPEQLNPEILTQEYITKAKEIFEVAEIHLLSRMWEIGLQAIQDVKIAPDANAVCEMALIRMVYGSKLPDPTVMLKNIVTDTPKQYSEQSSSNSQAEEDEKKNFDSATTVTAKPAFNTQEDISRLLSEASELELLAIWEIKCIIHKFSKGSVQISPAMDKSLTPRDVNALKKFLNAKTDLIWDIDVITQKSDEDKTVKTIFDTKKEIQSDLIDTVQNDPIIKTVLETFPGSFIAQVKENKKNQVVSLPSDSDLINQDEITEEEE